MDKKNIDLLTQITHVVIPFIMPNWKSTNFQFTSRISTIRCIHAPLSRDTLERESFIQYYVFWFSNTLKSYLQLLIFR